MTEPRTDFAGRVALVTGSSRGIGLAIAAELLDRGAAVAITSRKAEPLNEAAKELVEAHAGGAGDRVLAVAGNAGADEDRAEVVRQTMDRFGRLDVLVNNTGINPTFGFLPDADLNAARKIFDTNVVGALGFVQLAWKAWQAEHGGSIVNIASVAGLRSSGVLGIYGASKAALIRLTEELAWQLGPKVRVNAVAPAVVKTKFAEALYTGREDEASAAYPAKRLGTPEDVARLVAFLASDAADWITGETVRVDGGLLATGSLG
ncbi:SDR family oxidoreductase [Gandjariella thermophila]|uniref:3-oxoacyl-ACP reductase n=1 Tax=Gandjariella thermophila TaxID=1931992 RepID=A0A4D4IXK5_9PSEU|nr:SDR family oxidoreductase [Gandjariella thermophila]GDY28951.1 3-oxoacyl-ACP reductase [Gandjariella thermophila]